MQSVLIIHPEGNSFNNPSIKSLIDLLCDQGIEITLRRPKSIATVPEYRTVAYSQWGLNWGRAKLLIFDMLHSRWLSGILMAMERLLVGSHFDLIIGVDRQGLIEGFFWQKFTKTPYIFWSFEIMFSSETSSGFKKLEIEASEKVSLWFVQDELRAEKLVAENHLELHKCRIVPLASAGDAEPTVARLRDNLGIPQNQKVAIIIGSLDDWTMAGDIIETVPDWPDDWCLIIHHRYGKTGEFIDQLNPNLKPLVSKKIYISDRSVDLVDKMGEVLSGCSLGLAFYRPSYCDPYTGKNLEYLGMASGKIATFWRYGIPIMVNRIGFYSDLTERENAGVILSGEPGLMPKLLENNDFTEMASNAKRAYSKYLDFNLFKEKVWLDLSLASTKS